jgi:alkanesulfonate monooxygenase SsuD/methylene tetrahydromethanopterin reductase-like flavin-dependent oxidoreductase (luciferase family)
VNPSKRRTPKFGLYIDFRNPPQWPQKDETLYAENVELAHRAEESGFAAAWVSEHHFSDDGYAPSPLVLAAALAQVTNTMRIGTAVAVLPLYNAIRFAEDTAVLDVLSAGRLEVGVGVGWRAEEFGAFNVPMRERGKRTDAALDLIRQLWSGQPLVDELEQSAGGLRLAPRPIQSPGPRIWIGGSSRAALRRAALRGDGIIVSGYSAEMRDAYHEQLLDAGRDPREARVASNLRWFMVSHDPQRTFQMAAPYVLNWYNHYANWGITLDKERLMTLSSTDELRARNVLTVLSPADGIAAIEHHIEAFDLEFINVKMRPPGMPFDMVLEHLNVWSSEILPHFS